MKAHLMHRDEDFDADGGLPANTTALTRDLELDTLLGAMAGDDRFLFGVARRALLRSLREPASITYRQEILTDCLAAAAVVRELYDLCGEAIEAAKTVWGSVLDQDAPRRLLHVSVRKMEILITFLRRLRDAAAEHGPSFRSPGLTRFATMLGDELDEAFFELIEGYLTELAFAGGMLISARLAAGNKGSAYMLRRAPEQGLITRVLDRSGYSFTVPDRDDDRFRALGDLEDEGANLVANALAQSVDHVLSFFATLRTELGFYVACLNLHDRLAAKQEPMALPTVVTDDQLRLGGRGLYDVCLSLTIDERAVGNDIDADGRSLVIITGANQGGKSTFLRGLGLAQLMAQCGMFVAAEAFHVNACRGVFTHYSREEDETMQSGRLDEELARMSDIADHIGPRCLLLSNESFTATNEREGSQIARQVLDALLSRDIKVVFVTHLFDLAHDYHERHLPTALFLRAERGVRDGGEDARPYRLSEGEPLPTSYGADSYRKVFGRRPA